MACPHFEVKIITKTKRSAVAASAYISASRLFCENEQVIKNHTKKADEIFYKDVLLPVNAPESFKDREVLWNSVEMNERQHNGQLSRSIIAAIPREIPKEERVDFIREYCEEQFVSKGMCCDVAIHDPPGKDNPHVHIMLTMRALDEDGKWMAKSRKVYILDENGNKTYYPNGQARSRKVNTTDWNNRGNVEKWRMAWQDKANLYLERCGSLDRLDLRSFERQGKAKLPTTHLGPAANALEKKGTATGIGELNRNIYIFNELIDKVSEIFDQIVERFILLDRKQTSYTDPFLTNFLFEYVGLNEKDREYLPYNERIVKETQDLADVYSVICLLKSVDVLTLSDLEQCMSRIENNSSKLPDEIRALKERYDEIDHILSYRDLLTKKKPVYDKYNKIFFDKAKKKFYADHKKDLDLYFKCRRYLKDHDTGATKNRTDKELISLKENINDKITSFQNELNVKSSDSYVKLKMIYDTVKASVKIKVITAKDKEEFIKESKTSLKDMLDQAKKKANDQYHNPYRHNNEKNLIG